MKRRHFLQAAGVTALTSAGLASCSSSPSNLQKGEIMHTVIFDLKHPVGSVEAEQFLTDGTRILTSVPGVQEFQALRQCSPKNDYQYGFLMRFPNQSVFDAYTAHPDHCKFVDERWNTEVTRFQESDFML
jgi:Stress responsive A/B Barrel Domain